ncbi:FAD:protein FMN transferase [Variovorax sp. J22R133]|uniref:FAD:protein FMN transferase n=1 Tax=Variovorax brevis TaxID=3053503 RepID=UPI0025776038|nr:FAD:protein FMN transferase [Variovorax sp. J22R133]MDM0113180.1 FAD:protein FMN transferase [Variovorax sp. J22R133]
MGLSFEVRRGGGYANAPLPRRVDPASLQTLTGESMGTTWSVRIDNPAMLPLAGIRAAIDAALGDVVRQMSTWESDSDISRFNRAATGTRHVLKPEFARVLACALHWAQESDGAIDPTVGPLVGFWGFGAQASANDTAPSPDAAQAVHERVGWRRIAFDASTSTVLQPGDASLDLSGIAKGFAVDHVAAALRALDLANFLIEIGGELRASGHRPGGIPWQVQIEMSPGTSSRVALSDTSIATSGDRWHVREREGRRWSHSVDPRTGEPAGDALASVSVLHRECMQADALATLLTVLGPLQGMEFARRHSIAALFAARGNDGLRLIPTDRWPAAMKT